MACCAWLRLGSLIKWIFAHDDHGADLAGQRAIDHLGHRQPGLRRQAHVPGALKAAADFGVVNALIGGVDGGQAAAVGAALDVVLAAQGVEPGARLADVAGHQGQVGEGEGVVGAVGALADAHAPVEGGALRVGVHARRCPDVIGRDATDALGPFRREALQRLDVVVKIFGAGGDEVGVVTLLRDDDVRHGLEDGDVGARLLSQPERREVRQLDLARIDDDEFGIILAHGFLKEEADDGVRLGGVAAGDDEGIQVFHLGDAVAHGAGADGQLQAGHAAGVAEARAVIDVVGAQHGAHPLLEDEVVLVAGLGAGVGGDAVAAAFGHDGRQAFADQRPGPRPSWPHGTRPARRCESAACADGADGWRSPARSAP